MTRSLCLVAFALIAASPAFAQDDPKQREIDDLRQRLIQADDQALELARRYDQERKRLMDEKAALLKEVTELRRENALLKARVAALEAKLAGGKQEEAKSPLDERKLSLNFDGTPLSEVLMFLRDITGMNFVVAKEVDASVGISLRLEDISLRNVLDLLAASTEQKLEWVEKAGVIEFRVKAKEAKQPQRR